MPCLSEYGRKKEIHAALETILPRNADLLLRLHRYGHVQTFLTQTAG